MDVTINAAYAREITRRNKSVIVRRVIGSAPNSSKIEVTVLAIVRGSRAAGEVGAFAREAPSHKTSEPSYFLETDLAALSFPLPMMKNDKVVVDGDALNVTDVDRNTREIAGGSRAYGRCLMFAIKINYDKIKIRFDSLPANLIASLTQESTGLAQQLLSKAQSKASGDVLQIKSGKFVASIQEQVKVNAKSVVGKVFSRDPRAGIFEYGGHTKPHLIQAKNGKALAFLASGGEVYAAVVHHPGSNIAKHSVINSSFEEMQSQIINGLKLAGLGVMVAD